ncbi:MAG: DUF6288 domain-containing protein [Akkermansiaceae bacterium]
MKYFNFVCCLSVTLGGLGASVLPTPQFKAEGSWYLPGGGRATVVESSQEMLAEVKVPELNEKEAAAGGEWRGMLAVDLFGTPDGKRGVVRAEAIDPGTGVMFASADATVEMLRAPRADWAVIASSEHDGATAAEVFDGDPKTGWHSRYGNDQAKPPHWIGLAFGESRRLDGLRFLPRQGGFTNGVPRKWRVEVREPGGDWRVAAAGESEQVAIADKRGPLEVKFESPLKVEAFRFVIESDWSGGGFGTAAEITPLGVTLEKSQPPADAGARIWLEVPPKLMTALTGKVFGLRLTGLDGRVVVGEPQWCRVSTELGGKLFGRSNGGLGPDKLGAGLLGFTAMTEHQQTALPVIEVRNGGPSDLAGLQKGDVIVSVANKPLPVNDLAPGWKWFHQSHEAVLGRASEAALTTGAKTLELGVLREGKVVILPVNLARSRPFTSLNPASDPEAKALLADMLEWVVKNQNEDGSWSGDMKRTTFAALALLATGEKRYENKVRRAVDWGLKRYPTPDKHGNLGFWGGAYGGILYSEWFLHSGDKRVLPHLEMMRDWAYNGRHMSKWEVPALGHGPSGLPYDQKALVAPACHLLVFEALAMRCGMDDKLWDMLMPYMEMSWSDPKDGGHGALGYNRSAKDLGEFFSRSGLFAMACHLRGERTDMRDAMTKIMTERHPWIRNSHAYGEPGGGLGLLALQLSAPESYQKVIHDYAWWFSLAWQPGYGLKFTQPHMGAPYMGEDELFNVVYALVLQSPKRNLHTTGRPK